MPRPAFCIVETFPVYCRSTDALRGSKSRVVRFFETEAYARAVAARLAREDYEADFEVRDAANPFKLRVPPGEFQPCLKFGVDDVIPF
jgi:hypothetical protein